VTGYFGREEEVDLLYPLNEFYETGLPLPTV